jgi:UDP-glucose 4-epimerase
MKCIVTGGAGFIGSHVVSELIKRRFDVTIYDIAPDRYSCNSSRVKFVQGDIRDCARVSELLKHADAIFHLAGLLGTSELFDIPRQAFETNVSGALNVLLACQEIDKSIRIFFPTKPNEWNNLYSITAQTVERLGHAFRENVGLDVRVFRLWNVYGPRQKLVPVRKAMPLFICRALEDHPIEIFGDGTQMLELLFVEDVAKAIVNYTLYDGEVLETFELKANIRMSVQKIAKKIIVMIGSKSETVYLSQRRGETGSNYLAHARDVGDILGDLVYTDLEAALRRTIDWYRNISPDILAEAHQLYDR